MSFSYIYKGVTHTDHSVDYMKNHLGMDDEQIESVQLQEIFVKTRRRKNPSYSYLKELCALAETQAAYDSETGEELTPAVYYTNEATGEPWYHVDSTEPLDVPNVHQVTPQPNHQHEFAGIKTYHYRFASQAEFYELVPEAAPVDEEEEA